MANKHRQTVFAVVRTETHVQHHDNPVIIGVYYTLNRAEEIAGRSAQQFRELGIDKFDFEVQTSTIYDE